MTPAKGAIMNPIKKTVARAKEFVSDHKIAIAVTATAVVTTTAFVAVIQRNQAEMNEFLTEHNLIDEFYSTQA
jgi:hypothetical protein